MPASDQHNGDHTVVELRCAPEHVRETGLRAYVPPTLLALYDHNNGLVLIALAQFFFASMSTSVKFLMETTTMSTNSLIFVRMSITGGFCMLTLFLQGDPYPLLGPPEVRKFLVWRGFAGCGGLWCAYNALRGLSVSDAVTIGFLAPSVTAFLGFVVLGESFSWKEAMAGFSSLFGVVLISRPPFIFGKGWGGHDTPVDEMVVAAAADPDSTSRLISVIWALVGVLFSANAYLTIRYIGKRANALHSIHYFSMACVFASGIGILFSSKPIDWPHDSYGFTLIFIIGIFGFFAQCLLTFGLQREKAGRGSLAMYLQIFFAVLLELFVFHKVPSFLSLVGTAIILTSAGWVAMSSLKQHPPPTEMDPESAPISRTPSPITPGAKTIRGELYSYAAVPSDLSADDGADVSSSRRRPPSRAGSLAVPMPRYPGA